MKFIEFINKYYHQDVDFDNKFGCQCVDLFRQYCHDVLSIPHTGVVDGARELWFKFGDNKEKDYFLRFSIVNARYGDTIIWDKTDTNEFGHVALFVGWVGDKVLVFEQNGFKQDGCHLSLRDKDNCLGILRPKNIIGE